MAEGPTPPPAKRPKRDTIAIEPIQPSSTTSEIGPGDETLTPDDAVHILEELLSAQNQSYVLGLKLQLPLHIVEGICKDHVQPRDRLLQVLIEFTKQVDPRPTWRVIVDALKSPAVNLPRLGKIVEAAHFPQNKMATRATSSVPPGMEQVQSPAPVLPSKQASENHQNTASSAPRSLASRPTLPELLNFKTSSGSTINIVEQIGTRYSTLGPLLLNDKTGAITSNIVSQHQRNAVAINQQILTRWMQGIGKKPVAWSTLISILRDIELSELAKTIEDYLMTQIDAQIKEQKMKNTKLQEKLEIHKQEMEGKIKQLQEEIKQKETEKNRLVEVNNKELAQAQQQVKQQEQPRRRELDRLWRSSEALLANIQKTFQQTDPQLETLEEEELLSYTCHVSGPGLQSAIVNHPTHVIVELAYSGNRPCSLQQNVTAELVPTSKNPATSPIRVLSTVHGAVFPLSSSKYEITYIPATRGQHKLHVRINGNEIDSSPFIMTIYLNPTQLVSPVSVIKDMITPHCIAFNSRGNLVISERTDNQISIFDTEGQRIRSFSNVPDGMRRPRGIAIDDTDHIYVSSENKLQKFTGSGELIKTVGQKGSKEGKFNEPHGIVLHDKELYVCDSMNDRIQVFDMDLTYIRSIGSRGKEKGKFSMPQDIKFDSDGNMYVAEWGNARVQVMDGKGYSLRVFGEEDKLGRPSALHIVNKYVYVSECDNDCIVVYETSGEFVTSFGKRGNGEGEFASPRSIISCVDSYIYVCDQDNDRVQVF